jgi:hypothetical protein
MNVLPHATDLFSRAQTLRQHYLNAKPWPHLVIDNAFFEGLLDKMAIEIPTIDPAHLISSTDVRQNKQEASEGLGPATRHFLDFVDSASFREFI